jgi:hypothetical protein
MMPKFDLYRRHGLSIANLRAAIQSDPKLRAEAEAEYAAVEPFAEGNHLDGRCVMSKEYAAILRQALA